VGLQRWLCAALDATLIALVVDLPAGLLLGALFLFVPGAPLLAPAASACGLFLIGFLSRDCRGGLSRKWLGFQIEDARGRPPGLKRSILRNLPLVVPVWNLFEGIHLLREPSAPRPIDRRLGLRITAIP